MIHYLFGLKHLFYLTKTDLVAHTFFIIIIKDISAQQTPTDSERKIN